MGQEETMGVFPVQSHNTQNTQLALVSLEVTVAFLLNQVMEDTWQKQLATSATESWRSIEGKCLKQVMSYFQKRLMVAEGADTRHGC